MIHLVCEGHTKTNAAAWLGVARRDLGRYQNKYPIMRRALGTAKRLSSTSEFSIDRVRELLLDVSGLEEVPEDWKWAPLTERVPPLTPWEVLGIPQRPPPQDEEMRVIAADVIEMEAEEAEEGFDLKIYPGKRGLCDYTWTIATDRKMPTSFRAHALALLHRREAHLEALDLKREIAAEQRKAAGARFSRPVQGTDAAAAPKGRQRGLRAAAVEEVRRELIGPKPLRGAAGDASD